MAHKRLCHEIVAVACGRTISRRPFIEVKYFIISHALKLCADQLRLQMSVFGMQAFNLRLCARHLRPLGMIRHACD